ncbi:MAG: hypothetical protein AAGF04_01500 [Chlamydiota bacterium]
MWIFPNRAAGDDYKARDPRSIQPTDYKARDPVIPSCIQPTGEFQQIHPIGLSDINKKKVPALKIVKSTNEEENCWPENRNNQLKKLPEGLQFLYLGILPVRGGLESLRFRGRLVVLKRLEITDRSLSNADLGAIAAHTSQLACLILRGFTRPLNFACIVSSKVLSKLKHLHIIAGEEGKIRQFGVYANVQSPGIKALNTLWLSGKLLEVPRVVYKWGKTLRCANFQNNCLQDLQPGMAALQHLEKLYLQENNLQRVPEVFQQFCRLTDIDLGNNPLTKVKWTQFPTSLKKLNLGGCCLPTTVTRESFSFLCLEEIGLSDQKKPPSKNHGPMQTSNSTIIASGPSITQGSNWNLGHERKNSLQPNQEKESSSPSHEEKQERSFCTLQ